MHLERDGLEGEKGLTSTRGVYVRSYLAELLERILCRIIQQWKQFLR